MAGILRREAVAIAIVNRHSSPLAAGNHLKKSRSLEEARLIQMQTPLSW